MVEALEVSYPDEITVTVPCEFAVRAILPALRAMVARELSVTYHLRQHQIARLLDVTQSAISQYLQGLRGRAIDIEHNPDILVIVRTLASKLVTSSMTFRQTFRQYCLACRVIRRQRILCSVHQHRDPSYATESCDVCIPPICTFFDKSS